MVVVWTVYLVGFFAGFWGFVTWGRLTFLAWKFRGGFCYFGVVKILGRKIIFDGRKSFLVKT